MHAGEVAEVVDGQRHVGGQGLADRLAVVPGLGERRAWLQVLLDPVGDLVQDRGPLGRRGLAPGRRLAAWAASSASSMSAASERATSQNAWPVTGDEFSKYRPLDRRGPLAADEVAVPRFIRHQRLRRYPGRAKTVIYRHSSHHETVLYSSHYRRGNNGFHDMLRPLTKAHPYLWLEDILGERAAGLGARPQRPDGGPVRRRGFRADARPQALEVLDTDARIPYVRPPRRIPVQLLARRRQPARPVATDHAGQLPQRHPRMGRPLDVDELGRADDRELGVGRRQRHLPRAHPRAGQPFARRLGRVLSLREFDMADKEFVADGFALPEAKSGYTLGRPGHRSLVGTDFGAGSLTESGYPRIIKRWRRGQSFDGRGNGLRGRAQRRHRVRRCRPHARLRADRAGPGPRLLQRRGLRTARCGADPHRRTHRRVTCRCTAQWLLIELRTDWSPAPPATPPVRCWRPTTTNSSPAQHSCRGVRARRAHQPEPLRLDP